MAVDLISIHAYLCADGYVIKSKNPKYKYFKIGLRNTNPVLLRDFQEKFEEKNSSSVFSKLGTLVNKAINCCKE